MAEVPALSALVRTFLSKADVPQLTRDQERTVRAKTRELFRVADDLHKTVLRERRDNMVKIRDLTAEATKSYERGRAAAMAEGLAEMRAMYEQQMVANMVQTRAHWAITKKWQDTLADTKATDKERKAEKQNRREWKKCTMRAVRDAGDTRRAMRGAVAALVAATRAAADEQDVAAAVAAADAAAVAAADVEAIDGAEAAEDLAKMAAEARALADAAKAAAEAAAAAAAALAAAQAAARPKPGLTPVPSVRQRVDSTDVRLWFCPFPPPGT